MLRSGGVRVKCNVLNGGEHCCVAAQMSTTKDALLYCLTSVGGSF